MLLTELPQNVQEQLNTERAKLHRTWKTNNAYHVRFTNLEGTRYFVADRVCENWSDDKGNYMPFGGGTHWRVRYGKILWSCKHDSLMGTSYYWVCSKKVFGKAANGTIVPNSVATKKEVMELAKSIGIFDI